MVRCPYCGCERAHIDWDSDEGYGPTQYYCPCCGATFTEEDLLSVHEY